MTHLLTRSAALLTVGGVIALGLAAAPATASTTTSTPGAAATTKSGLFTPFGATSAQPPRSVAGGLGAFIAELAVYIVRAQARYKRYYNRTKRQRIKRTIRRVAANSELVRALKARPSAGTALRFGFGDVVDFAEDALGKVKSTVGGALKLIPATRLGRCGLFGSVAAIEDVLDSESALDTATDAAYACIGVSLPPARD